MTDCSGTDMVLVFPVNHFNNLEKTYSLLYTPEESTRVICPTHGASQGVNHPNGKGVKSHNSMSSIQIKTYHACVHRW